MKRFLLDPVIGIVVIVIGMLTWIAKFNVIGATITLLIGSVLTAYSLLREDYLGTSKMRTILIKVTGFAAGLLAIGSVLRLISLFILIK
jgi:hypothetical protein